MNALQFFNIDFFKENIPYFYDSEIVEYNNLIERRVIGNIDLAFHNDNGIYYFLDAVYVEGSYPVPYTEILFLFNDFAQNLIKAKQKELDLYSIDEYENRIIELQAKIDELTGEVEDTTGMDVYDDSLGRNQKYVAINKISVKTEYEKDQLLKAFRYIHDLKEIDSNYMAVNAIMHIYMNPDLIVVE